MKYTGIQIFHFNSLCFYCRVFIVKDIVFDCGNIKTLCMNITLHYEIVINANANANDGLLLFTKLSLWGWSESIFIGKQSLKLKSYLITNPSQLGRRNRSTNQVN